MADEMVVVECGKCGAKLKVKAIALKVLKDIKCGKCGNKVPLKKEQPVTTDSTPIPVSASLAPPNPPAPEKPRDLPPAPPASAPPPKPPPASTGAGDLVSARARIKELEERVASLLDQAGQLTTARQRIAELELKNAQSGAPSDAVAHAQREIHEQGERISELQQLWMQKEKETREAVQQAERAKKERLDAIAERERTVAAIKELLANYHKSEIESAQKRMADLDQKIQSFISASKAPSS